MGITLTMRGNPIIRTQNLVNAKIDDFKKVGLNKTTTGIR
jgi:hypothetical protein